MDILIDDIIFAPKPQGLDITIVSPHSQPYIRYKGKRPVRALQQADAIKHSTYGGIMHSIKRPPKSSRTSPDRFRYLRYNRKKVWKKGLNPLFEFISTKKGRLQKRKGQDSAILDSTPALCGCCQSSPIRCMLYLVI